MVVRPENNSGPYGICTHNLCTGIVEVMGTKGPEFFSGLISTTSSVVFIAARISYIRFFTAVHMYDFHMSTKS